MLGIVLCPISASICQTKIIPEKLDKMPIGVFEMGYTTDGKVIYSSGGKIIQGGVLKNSELVMLYTPLIDKWSRARFSDTPKTKGAVASTYDQKSETIFTVGFGEQYASEKVAFPMEIVVLNNYSLNYYYKNPHIALESGIESYNGHIYVFGGYNMNSESDELMSKKLFVWDLQENTWYEKAEMPNARVSESVLIEDNIYLVGGETEDGPIAEILKYDIKKDEWAIFHQLPVAHQVDAVSKYKNHIIALLVNENESIVVIMNTDTRETKLFPIDYYYENPGMVILNEYVYLFGGYARPSNTGNRRTFRFKVSELF